MKNCGVLLFIFMLGATCIQAQSDLVCMNKTCFKPAMKSKSIISVDTTAQTTPDRISSVFQIQELAGTEEEKHYLSSPEYSQNSKTSKYFGLSNKQIPVFRKRFMNVPSYDMDYGTKPEFESTRPQVSLNIFHKKTWPCAKTRWE